MAEQDFPRGLLWMFRRGAADGDMGGAGLDPSGSLYTLFRNTQNPFLRRAVTPSPRPSGRSSGELSRLVQFFGDQKRYQAGPANRGEPYRRRALKHPAPAPTHAPSYAEPARLLGDTQHLPLLVDEFFRATLDRLRADPQDFAAVVQELVELFRQHGITLRIYEAYHALQDWNDLMDTLAEIAQYPSVETFDLFCSALLAYHDLAYGPDPA